MIGKVDPIRLARDGSQFAAQVWVVAHYSSAGDVMVRPQIGNVAMRSISVEHAAT
jgi:hypothetical protein